MEKKPRFSRREFPPREVSPVSLALLFAAILLLNALLYLYLSTFDGSSGRSETDPGLCPSGYFRLGAVKNCSPWLSCEAINREVRKLKCVGEGAVKKQLITVGILGIWLLTRCTAQVGERDLSTFRTPNDIQL